MRIGFLGAGNMATALVQGVLAERLLCTSQIRAADISPEAREKFLQATGVEAAADALDMMDEIDALVIAVKPQVAEEAMQRIAGRCADKLVVSIAAGIRLEKVCEWVGHRRVVRVMPNTPSTIRQGASAFASAEEVTENDREWIASILHGVGWAVELEEECLDTVTALSGSGPAYVFEFASAMIAAGEKEGLSHDVAAALTAQTLAGAAAMLKQGNKSAEDLRKAVTSPGGTTEAGLRVLEEHDLRQIMQEVIAAARNRSIQLS